jgi:hypothetical protein
MNKEKSLTQASNDAALQNDAARIGLERQIEHFRGRVAWHKERGRDSGTYDHDRLAQLEQLREELNDGEQNLERDHRQD